jgi:hypothetical protein
MNQDISKTLKKRHEKMVEYLNEIWKLEKDKFYIREALVDLNDDLSASREALSKLNVRTKNNISLGANLKPTQNSIAKINKELSAIKNKQLEFLEKIKSIINI